MDIGNQSNEYIPTASDQVIFEEAAKRLKKIYLNQNGYPLMSAAFEFQFDDGRFLGIVGFFQNFLYRAKASHLSLVPTN